MFQVSMSRSVRPFLVGFFMLWLPLLGQQVLWEHDFTRALPGPGVDCQGTLLPGEGLVCDRGYYSLSIPLVLKGAIRIDVRASYREQPVNLALLLVHRQADGTIGTFKPVTMSMALSNTISSRSFTVRDPSFSGAGKSCSLNLYRVRASDGAFGAKEPVLVRHIRITAAPDAEADQPPYLAPPCVWDGAHDGHPALRLGGKRVMDGGATVADVSREYVVGILQLTCQAQQDVMVDIEAKTTGHPASTLGVILYDSEKDLKKIQGLGDWMTPVKKGAYGRLNFKCPGYLIKKSGRYTLYVYRSNQQGSLFVRRVSVQAKASGKTVTFLPKDMPDVVGPFKAEPSGSPDFHIRLTGLDASKSIREVEVTNETGGRWVSGDDVKKNFYMIQYYDSADYEARRHPRTNFNGQLHGGLSAIDLLFESILAGPDVIAYTCTVHYSDGTRDSWKVHPPKREKPLPPPFFTHEKNVLVARQDYQVPVERWRPNPLGGRSFWTLMSPSDKLQENFLMKGDSYRRIWSLGWFLPLTAFHPNPTKESLRHYGISYHARIALRELQVFDRQGNNLAPKAVVSAQCPQKIVNVKALNDGDLSRTQAVTSAAPVYDGDQQGSFVLDFGRPVEVERVVVHHGMKNGSALGWIAKDFSWQYRDASGWHVPEKGGVVAGNDKPMTEHRFQGLTCTALCLTITSQHGLYDYGTMNFDVDNPLLNLKKTDELAADIPFHYWYLSHEGILNFALPDKVTYDPRRYHDWKKKHPHFQGFQLVEFDNDLGTFLGWDREWNVGSAKRAYDAASQRLVVYRDIPARPKTREEAVQLFHDVYQRYASYSFHDVCHFLGISIWTHYGLEWGASSVVFENAGGGCPVLAMQVAASRGAARQYGNKPWGMYMANYLGGKYLNYHENVAACGPHKGKSASLYRRQLYLTYLMGANYVDFEHPDLAFCYEKPKAGKMPRLTPHGKAVAELNDFSRKNPERGVPYAPVALLLDWTHGWRHSEGTKIFMGNFEPTLGDRNIDAWMKNIFGLNPVNQEGYGACMGMTGFTGLADILVLNPPSGAPKNLGDYKVAILAGDLKITPEHGQFLRDYVAEGGTLIVNVEQLPPTMDQEFTGVALSAQSLKGKEAWSVADGQKLQEQGEALAYEFRKASLKGASALVRTKDGLPLVTRHRYGQGQVILTLQKYLVEEPDNAAMKQGLPTIRYLLGLIRHEALPVTVKGDMPVELVLSRMPKGWRVATLNNQGVYKNGNDPERIDASETAHLDITLKAEAIEAMERIGSQPVRINRHQGRTTCTISIPPGDLKIIDFILEK